MDLSAVSSITQPVGLFGEQMMVTSGCRASISVQYCLAVVFQIGVNKTVSTSPPNTVATCRYNIKVGSQISTRFPAAMVTMSTPVSARWNHCRR